MTFIHQLSNRIRNLIGLNYQMGEDFSFFQPGGNDSFIQFFYKEFPEEYWDLSEWDRHNFFLMDLHSTLNLNFSLDEDARFATLEVKTVKGVNRVQAVMDLRDDLLVLVYFFGESKACHKINQALRSAPGLTPCYLNTTLLDRLSPHLEKINAIQYDFEQLTTTFLDPVSLCGLIKGDLAHQMYEVYSHNHRAFFNVTCLAGHLKDGSQGTVHFMSRGIVQVDVCRLSTFLELANETFTLLRERRSYQESKNVCSLNVTDNREFVRYQGEAIEYGFTRPIDKIEGLLRQFTHGDKSSRFLGISERISRRLWSVKTTEVTTRKQVELEIFDRGIRLYLSRKSDLSLGDQIESYLRKHVCAEL